MGWLSKGDVSCPARPCRGWGLCRLVLKQLAPLVTGAARAQGMVVLSAPSVRLSVPATWLPAACQSESTVKLPATLFGVEGSQRSMLLQLLCSRILCFGQNIACQG